MKDKRDEVWYCENSKGQKIPPYGDSYPVAKPKTGFERVLDVVGWMIGMSILMACLLAMFSFTPKLICGEKIGEFNNIPVYYNDGFDSCSDRNWSEDGSYSYGLKWQCVEYVRRYYYDALNHRMPNRWGNASDYFRYSLPSGTINIERNLVQYHNGDTKPQVNDILVWAHGYGHVAIVTEVLSDGVKVIGQNTGKHCNDFIKVKLNKHGKYIIDKDWCSGLLRIKE